MSSHSLPAVESRTVGKASGLGMRALKQLVERPQDEALRPTSNDESGLRITSSPNEP